MNAVLHCVPPPARQVRDERLPSEAAHDAAAVLTARWAAGTIGAGDAYDAELLGHLSTLDFVAGKLAEIEAAEAAGRRRSAVHAVGAPIASGGSRPIYGKRARRFWRRLLSSFVRRERPAISAASSAPMNGKTLLASTDQDIPGLVWRGPLEARPWSCPEAFAQGRGAKAFGVPDHSSKDGV